MKTARSNSQLFADGRQFEEAGKWEDAAKAYQRVVDNDPGNQDAVARLLVVYRKMKDYSGELAVIDAAINAAAARDKATQREWISANPKAARLGKAVLRQLGGESVTAYGTDPFVEKLMKRRRLVEKRTGSGKKRAGSGKKKAGSAGKKVLEERKRRERERKDAVARKEAEARKAEAERKKKEAAERAAAAEKKRKEAEAERRRREKEAMAHPSLFIVSLRYLVALERIDAAMENHVAFLDKYFAQRVFLAAGRLVPRTGGIILVRAKSRGAVEKIMKQDPFLKRKLASVDIVEFVASKMDGRLRGIR